MSDRLKNLQHQAVLLRQVITGEQLMFTANVQYAARRLAKKTSKITPNASTQNTSQEASTLPSAQSISWQNIVDEGKKILPGKEKASKGF